MKHIYIKYNYKQKEDEDYVYGHLLFILKKVDLWLVSIEPRAYLMDILSSHRILLEKLWALALNTRGVPLKLDVLHITKQWQINPSPWKALDQSDDFCIWKHNVYSKNRFL